jgi:hypothetical protein
MSEFKQRRLERRKERRAEQAWEQEGTVHTKGLGLVLNLCPASGSALCATRHTVVVVSE